MRSYCIRVDPKSNADVFIRERREILGYRDTEETQGRRPCDYGGRDWGCDAAINQGMPRIAGSHQKPRRGKKEFSPSAFGGSMALLTP